MRDVIVIGLGAMGSAAALHLAHAGADVLGLDAFEEGHERGSSHGATRVIRRAYAEGAVYMPLLERAYELWAALEAEAGERLLIETGGLDIGLPGGDMVTGALETARAAGIAHELLDAAALRARFPTIRTPAGHAGLFVPGSGQLRSDAANAAMRRLAREAGAELRWTAPVRAWRREQGGFAVETGDGPVRARKLVIAAGAWAGVLVPSLDPVLAVERQVVGWFPPRPNAAGALDGLPVFQVEDETGGRWYVQPPACPGEHVKIGLYGHRGERGAAMREGRPPDSEDASLLSAGLQTCLPGASPVPSALSQCRFTRAPGDRFLIGPLPGDPDVTILSPCSGHGYKFVPAIGEAAAALALEREPLIDLAPFAVSHALRA